MPFGLVLLCFGSLSPVVGSSPPLESIELSSHIGTAAMITFQWKCSTLGLVMQACVQVNRGKRRIEPIQCQFLVRLSDVHACSCMLRKQLDAKRSESRSTNNRPVDRSTMLAIDPDMSALISFSHAHTSARAPASFFFFKVTLFVLCSYILRP